MGDPRTPGLGSAEHEVRLRLEAEAQLNDLRLRVDNAQQLANMGDYDWHIPSDTNRWSDQLYRIYGYEPQSFNPSYERFLSFLHPDDRDRIQAIHQQALASGEPYEMTERIVRPDGEQRYLASNGQVLFDESGAPVRMRGTCIDVTDRVLAEREREEHAARAHEEQTRRRAALEINDNVLQGLTAALYALEMEDSESVRAYLRKTIDAARHVITDLSEPLEGDVAPGDLVRANAAELPSSTA
jgi:PAS domain S-box-containing protein